MPDRIPVSSALDEEVARAEVYGLLARLYHAPPSADLFEALRVSPTEAPAPGAFLEGPWRELVAVAREMPCDAVAGEFDALFGGVGKPEVYLFASHYLGGFLNDRPLVRLRVELDRLGLARDEAMGDTEDHLSYLCEVMRYLIADDDVALANLARQRDFFANHLQPWVPVLCQALAAHPRARFYAALSTFTHAFVEVEAQAFDMLS